MSVMVSVPLSGPGPVGVYVTLMVHVAPFAKAPQDLEAANGAAAVAPLMVTIALPVFFTATDRVLVLPTVTLPKFKLVGDTLTVADDDDEPPVPDRLMV